MCSVHSALIALALIAQPAKQRVIVYDLEGGGRTADTAQNATHAILRQLGNRPELTAFPPPEDPNARLEAEVALEGGVLPIGSGFLAVLIATEPGSGRARDGEACRADDESRLIACLLEAADRMVRGAEAVPIGRAGGSIVVNPLDSYQVADKVARNVAGILRIELQKVGGLRIVPENGDWEVRGTVGRFDQTSIVHLELLDPEKHLVHRVSEVFSGPRSELVQATRIAARRLVGVTTGESGTLAVVADVPNAQLSVDGGPAQPFSGNQQLSLSAGKHHLRLTAERHQPVTEEFYVLDGQTTTLRPSLREITDPWYSQWWVWTALGAALVVTGTVIGVAAANRPEDAVINVTVR